MKKTKLILRGKSGVTLAELLITFALTAIFTVGAIVVITPGFRIYSNMKTLNEAAVVSDIILDRISVDISTAGNNVTIDESGKIISFDSAYLYAKDGELLIHYAELIENGETVSEAVDHKLESASYRGFTVDNLRFTKVRDNLVRINLTVLHRTLNVAYSTEKIIECHNTEEISVTPVMVSDEIYFEN
ncbi:MAG: hypothetical protein Q4C42_02375 [Clostridia bacterium]|nr:hypothetical protein [Clostridia bacterium]